MATRAQLEDALIKAHESGDTEAAQLFASEIRSLGSGLKPQNVQFPIKIGEKPSVIGMLPKIAAGTFHDFAGGVNDIIQGGAQLAPRALSGVTSGFGLAPNRVSRYFDQEAAAQDAKRLSLEQAHQQARLSLGIDPSIPSTVERAVGRAAATLPLTAGILPATPSLGANALAGAKAGALSGALSPVEDTENYAGTKALQVGGGAALGAAVPAALDLTMRAGAGLLNAGTNLATRAAGRTLPRDAAAVARQQDFESLGIQPMTGQLTRDPTQFSREQNLKGIVPAVAERLNQQNRGLIEGINTVRSGTGSQAEGAFDTSSRMINDLAAKDTALRSGVSSAYEKFQNAAGLTTPLNPSRFANEVNDTLDRRLLQAALPADVRGKINQIATGKAPFSIREAAEVEKAINGLITREPSSTNTALKVVRDALRTEMGQTGSATGQAAEEALRNAQALASSRFRLMEDVPALTAASRGAQPDRFIDQFVLSKTATAREVAGLMGQLPAESQSALKGQVVDWLKGKALSGAADEVGMFSQSAYDKALASVGPEKLRAMFTPTEIEQLRTIGNVASYIQRAPVGEAVNRSHTGAAVANLAGRAMNIPLGPININLASPIGALMRSREASKALAGTIPTPPNNLVDPAIARLYADRLGLLGIPIGPALLQAE